MGGMPRSSSVGNPWLADIMETSPDGDAPDSLRFRGGRQGPAHRIADSMENMGAESTVGATGRVAVHSPPPGHHSAATEQVLIRRASSLLSSTGSTPVTGPPVPGEELPLLGEGRTLRDDAATEEGPPLLVWIGPALTCALAYALYNIFIKKGSASINPVLGGVVLQLVAALLGCCVLGALVVTDDGGAEEVIRYDRNGVFWAVCAGVAVGVAEILSFCVSGMGVQATQSIPVIIGGSVVFGSVLGLVLLGEVMTTQGWLGVVLLVVGIALVATDPGQKAAAVGH